MTAFDQIVRETGTLLIPGCTTEVIEVSALRALLEGKILCDAEPVNFHCGNCHEGPLYKAAGAGEG